MAKAGWRTAAKYDEHFEGLYDRLADHQGRGAPRPALGQNIRIGIVTPYVVIYRNDDDSNTVTVLRIVHDRRRITGRMLGSA